MVGKESDFRTGHRKRLRNKFLEISNLTDSELLELLLTYAVPRIDVKPIVRALTDKFGSFHKIIAAPRSELLRILGIGPGIATFLKALHSGILRSYISEMKDAPIFQKFEILENYCKSLLGSKNIEEFHVFYLDKKNQLIEDNTHSAGTIDTASAYPREILQRALTLNAWSVILLHNHPSGSPLFSDEDKKLTIAVRNILKPVNIELFDHFLLANGLLFSAKGESII